MRRALCLLLAVACAACAAPHPKFYPNDHYVQVGDPVAQKDADECLAKAKQYLKDNPLKPVAKQAGAGAVVGAAIGVVVGAITGDIKGAIESGAAAGGVGGAAQGAIDENSPDAVTRSFTNRCLAEKGYEVIGWK